MSEVNKSTESAAEQRKREIQERLAAIKKEAEKAKAETEVVQTPAKPIVNKQPEAEKIEPPRTKETVVKTIIEEVKEERPKSHTEAKPETIIVSTVETIVEKPVEKVIPPQPTAKTEIKVEAKKTEPEKKTVTKTVTTTTKKTIKTGTAATTETPTKKKINKGLLWAIIAAAVIIIMVAVYIFIPPVKKSVNALFTKSETITQTTIIDKTETTAELVTDAEDDDLLKETTTNKNKADVRNTKEEEVVAEPTPKPVKKIDTPAKPVQKPVQEQVAAGTNKWGLNTPTFIISHSAFSKEDAAKKMVAELKTMGFNSGYYYIPDINPSGNKMYKVYAGSFEQRSQADEILAKVKNVNPDAYIEKVN